MMMAQVKLDIITPERVVYSQPVDMVVARAIDGDIGIMPGHTPLVTALETSVLKIIKDGEETPVPISDGFLEVKPEQVNVIVRTAELPEEIDVERAREARERAQRRLREERSRIDETRARAALERAMARIDAAEKRDQF